MADFDKFLAETAPVPEAKAATFDKFLAETAPTTPLPKQAKTSVGEAAIRGASSGALMGFPDEAYGLVGAIVNPTNSDKGFLERYVESRDYARRKDAEAKNDHPVVYGGSQLAGGLATAVVPGAAALNPATKATLGARLATGAGVGALNAAGESEHSPTSMQNLEGLVEDVKKGAITGAAAQGVIEAAGPLLRKAMTAIPTALDSIAERRAFKAAVGNQGKVYDEAVKQGTVNQIGRELIDSGAVGFGDKARAISEKAMTAKKAAGEEIGGILQAIDDRAPGLVEGKNIAQGLRDYAARIGGEGNASTVHKLEELATAYEGRGPMSLVEAQVEKNSFKFRPGDPGATFDKEANNRIKSIIGGEMEDAIGRFDARANAPAKAQFGEVLNTGSGHSVVVPVEGSPVLQEGTVPSSLREAYEAAKKRFGAMATSGGAAEKLANRQEKNATFGLLPTLAGVGGLIAGQGSPGYLVAGPAAAIAAKLARERGSSATAIGADKSADLLRYLGNAVEPYVSTVAKGNIPAAVTNLLSSPDQKKRDAISRRLGK